MLHWQPRLGERIAAGSLLLLAFTALPAAAGMQQDLSSCTAAKDRAGAAACTRVMSSGRLPREQMYIGYFNRGTAWRRAGEVDKAIDDFTKVLELKPGFARALEARGEAYADRGDDGAAMADLDAAVASGGADWRFRYSRAVLLRAAGKTDAAIADLDAAAALKSDAPHVTLMRALMRAEAGDYAQANADIDGVVAKGEEKADVEYARAAVAFYEGWTSDAESAVDRALALRAGFTSARALKARILEARGDVRGASEGYAQALDDPPDAFDSRMMRRTARERLASLGNPPPVASEEVKPSPAVAEASVEREQPLDCRVFLPATGSVVSAKCSE